MQKNRILKLFSQIAISLAIAVILLVHMDIRQFCRQFHEVSWPLLGVIILLLVPSVLLRACRWKLLFDDKSHRIGLGGSMTMLLVGMALNLVLPASSGDIAKSYFGYKWSGVKERMLSVSLLDKVIALASISILGIPCALLGGELLYAALSVLVLLPALVLIVLPGLIKNVPFCRKLFDGATKVVKKKLDFLKIVEEVSLNKGKLAVALALSVAGWLVTYFQMYLCFRAVGVKIPLFYVFSVAPLLTLVRLFPFTLSGVGSDEVALAYFFTRSGVSLELIIAGALVYRFFTIIILGLAGLFFLAGTKRLGYNKRGEQT
ncbi:MAG: lysylphosphatidylglycerol synthase transmembrane domain-containing protein [Planctomycetota bacterium]|jgi:uncharacterized protein (TIRG00374 family)